MAVVVDADDFPLEDIFEIFQVDDEARDGVDLSGNGDLKSVVVPVAVSVGTFAKDALVFLGRPCIVPVVVRGGKLRFAGEKDHEGPIL